MDNNNLYSAVNADGKASPRYYAMGSMILGILALSLSLIVGWAGASAWLGGLVFGIVGLVFANKAGKAGYTGGMRTTGMVLSIIAIALFSLALVACIGCPACMLCTGACLTAGML